MEVEDDGGISWLWDVCHPVERGLSGVMVRGESDKNAGTTLFVASTSSPDRAMDIVSQNWKLKNFRNNPVILADHNPHRVVGRAVEVSVPKSGDDAGKLMIRVEWNLGSSDKSIVAVGEQHLDGFRHAGSVGFRPGKRTRRDKLPTDHEAYQAPVEIESDWGGKYTTAGMYFESPELMEFSSVSLPMNVEAAQRSFFARAEGDPAADPAAKSDEWAWLGDAAAVDKVADALFPVLLARAKAAFFPEPEEDAPSDEPVASMAWRRLWLPRLYAAARTDVTLRRILAALPDAGPARREAPTLRGDGLDFLYPTES